ncbi:hypothetical protein EUGRSUZ_F04127 [Eucalyptus grandis]|uniref:Uncharacterized protein n=2 Tax=Eucalyptus grandis TaxID=71139 RepID=A0ACC3KPN5_EUCGR|nr:hypothetical protein EUGRSUZ_F04127 [Eucalyptus grandis]
MNEAEERDIVIVGGGICGLATALALHGSLVSERSECLHATGAATTIRANGWRALDHLGLGLLLRKDSVHIDGFSLSLSPSNGIILFMSDISLGNGILREFAINSVDISEAFRRKGEAQCIRRSDLVEALAEDLSHSTIRFTCHVISVKLGSQTSYTVLELHYGIVIKAKYLRMNPTKFSTTNAIRGFTSYPEGHGIDNLFVVAIKEQVVVGNSEISKNQELIKMSSLQTINDFQEEMKEMIKNSDQSLSSCLRLRYRALWDLMLGSFRKGTITVAGDALDAMSPFIGQGDSISQEDAIVMARCLAQKILEFDRKTLFEKCTMDKCEDVHNQYAKERRMRLIKLSTQSFLMNKMFETLSMVVKLFCIVFMASFFRDSAGHSQFD